MGGEIFFVACQRRKIIEKVAHITRTHIAWSMMQLLDAALESSSGASRFLSPRSHLPKSP
jgi:hypothetical protein